MLDFLQVTFPISGVTTNLLLPPLISLVISFFTSMGGISGAFLLLPFQMSVLELYRSLRERHQSRLQHRRHPERRIPLYKGRPHGLAAHLGRDRRHPAGRVYRLLSARALSPGPQGVQALRRVRAACISACGFSRSCCAARRRRPRQQRRSRRSSRQRRGR